MLFLIVANILDVRKSYCVLVNSLSVVGKSYCVLANSLSVVRKSYCVLANAISVFRKSCCVVANTISVVGKSFCTVAMSLSVVTKVSKKKSASQHCGKRQIMVWVDISCPQDLKRKRNRSFPFANISRAKRRNIPTTCAYSRNLSLGLRRAITS